LGEFEQARPIIEAWSHSYPSWEIIVSFYSPSGFEHRKNDPGAKAVIYLPDDTPTAMKDMVDLVQPDLVVIIKYEFWLNWLSTLHQRQIPIVLAAGRFHRGQPFFRWYGRAFRQALTWFSHIAVLDRQSEDLLRQLNADLPVSLAPDTRFDRVAAIAGAAWENTVLANFCGHGPVIVAGSVWPEDMRLWQTIIPQYPDCKWIIVPHEVHETTISGMENQLQIPVIRYSAFDGNHSTAAVMIVDAMGLLSRIYRYGTAAYVGGGFGKGIHSVLEPAAYGIPISFGPRISTFPEAQELVAQGAAVVLRTPEDAAQWMAEVNNPAYRARCGEAAADFVATNLGGSQRIVSLLEEIITP
jgi:3-deoxy-D-manno-octulosonic-acid transferase